MKPTLLLIAALFLQIAAPSTDTPTPEPQHFRYERTLTVAPNIAGQTCAVLDSTVFAHSASESLNDLRIYAQPAQTEIPFNFSVSSTQTDEDDAATVFNLGTASGEIVFDLKMPARPYSAVILVLSAKDFLATATVTGSSEPGGSATNLGTFALFDLTSQHLSRSTTLPLQESTFPNLHITLHFTPAPNSSPHVFAPSIVQGATVPPSREAQMLFTPIASTTAFIRQGRDTLATIHVPAHVPIERLSISLDPKFTANFSRSVEITATPDGTHDLSAVETVSGNISHVKLPQANGNPPIDNLQTSIDAPLGANLRSGATISIRIHNGDDLPLPLAAAQLEMRQRKLCFEAALSTPSYRLMYGDAALQAPVYDYARLFTPAPKPAIAILGAEQRNPSFTPRTDTRPFTERHPELLWVVLLAVIAVLASMVLRSARSRHN